MSTRKRTIRVPLEHTAYRHDGFLWLSWGNKRIRLELNDASAELLGVEARKRLENSLALTALRLDMVKGIKS